MRISSMANLWNPLVITLLFFCYLTTADRNGSDETFPDEDLNHPAKSLFGRFPFRPLFPQNPFPPADDDGIIEELPPKVGIKELTPKDEGEKGKEPGPVNANLGEWRIDSENAGVSAMHIQLMPNNNKAVWFDSTSNGISEINNDPPFCRPRVGGRGTDPKDDCTAHAVEYDIETAQVRPLKVGTSPWCSSGGLSKDGDLISTGGDKDGFKAIRILKPCPNCDFEENPRALFSNRWYATNHALPDGSFVVVGGRNAFNYEIVPTDNQLEHTPTLNELNFLGETEDDGGRENNLYPFVNLLPDGNLFVFANYKSIILNPYTGETVRPLPDLPGGARNYPPSGMSALLPINLDVDADVNPDTIDVEVIVCGGNTREAYTLSDLQQPKRTFLPASRDCGRLKVSQLGAQWQRENMPSPRVMGDMLILPTGDLLLINGAKAGTSAWDAADEPNLTPVLYNPNKPKGRRFQTLKASGIPRMYHSVSAVLPDGQVLVAGSNTNAFYRLPKYGDQYKFPSELRVEKFSPPYLAPGLAKYRLKIAEETSDKELVYGGEFNLEVESTEEGMIDQNEIKVTMYSPPFTTHGYSTNQRLLILKIKEVQNGKITVVAPPNGKLAPPGYYLVFVVHHQVPSRGMWVKIQ